MFAASPWSACPCFPCSGRVGLGRFEYAEDEDAYGAVSQNGWPASDDPADIDIITVSVPLRSGTKRMQVTRKASAALLSMVAWWDANIEPVTELGSYNFRPIRGYKTTISNHGSGTAVDINASKHPLAARGTVSAGQALRIATKAAELGLRWGGTYLGRADEMHVEISGGGKAGAIASTAAAVSFPFLTVAGVATVSWLGYREYRRRHP